ncbi:MAG: acyl-CoA reductase, partial [Bacteroidales bacterium]|nr:acyl-CoA reductase [Bacteroidales bacterium]
AVDFFDYIKSTSRKENLLYRIELNSLSSANERMRGHGGYFYEYSLKNLDELCDCVSEKYQTLTYFGVSPEELRSVVIQNCLRGIDRIVPVGKAMDIGTTWDGYDLVRILSRIVSFA